MPQSEMDTCLPKSERLLPGIETLPAAKQYSLPESEDSLPAARYRQGKTDTGQQAK